MWNTRRYLKINTYRITISLLNKQKRNKLLIDIELHSSADRCKKSNSFSYHHQSRDKIQPSIFVNLSTFPNIFSPIFSQRADNERLIWLINHAPLPNDSFSLFIIHTYTRIIRSPCTHFCQEGELFSRFRRR